MSDDKSKGMTIFQPAPEAEKKATYKELFEKLVQVSGHVSVMFSHPSREEPWTIYVHMDRTQITCTGRTSSAALLAAIEHVKASLRRR